ncbi:3659_t:CDS:2, partial [Ambispora leptoticha]
MEITDKISNLYLNHPTDCADEENVFLSLSSSSKSLSSSTITNKKEEYVALKNQINESEEWEKFFNGLRKEFEQAVIRGESENTFPMLTRFIKERNHDPAKIHELLETEEYRMQYALIREAKFMLAICYMQEIGTSRDSKLGFKFFKEASDRGHLDSKHRLGTCYMTGTGVTEDKSKAFKLWYDAAMLGSNNVQNELACCYCIGEAVQRDLHQTIRWLRKAIDNNDGESMKNLENLFK